MPPPGTRTAGSCSTALQGRGLLPEGAVPDLIAGESSTLALLREAVLTYLAQSPAALMEVRLEEIFGVAEQQNLPGTQTRASQLAAQAALDPGPNDSGPGTCPDCGPAECGSGSGKISVYA